MSSSKFRLPGDLLGELPHGRRLERLHARVAQLPGRASRVAVPLHAVVPEGPTRAQSHLREVRRAVRPGAMHALL